MLGIVIPAYKRKDCLRKTLQSLVLQTKQSFYVVVVDDHSPEPLKDVVDEFKWKLHIKYIYAEQNGGPGVARQIGLNYCYEKNFDYVIFLDSDDLLYPQAVARLDYEAQLSKSDIVSSGFWIEGKETGGRRVTEKNKTFVHGKIYNIDFLKRNDITFPDLRVNEDLCFNLKAFGLAQNIKYLDETLHLFCQEPSSITRNGENGYNLSADHIESIYLATIFLVEKGEIPDWIIVNILNCYNHCQKTQILGNGLSKERKKHMSWLLNLDKIQFALKEREVCNRLVGLIEQMAFINGEFITFPQTFKDWLEEYIDGNSNN